MILRLLLATTLLLAARTVSAQPAPPEVPPEPVAPEPAAPEPAPVADPVPPAAGPSAAPIVVSAEAKRILEEVNRALLNNQFDRAIELCQGIVDDNPEGELRSAAEALRDLAKRLKESKAHITLGSGPRVLASPDKESGRTSVVITTTLAAFYSSFALVDILGVSDFTPITVTVALTTAAGIGVSLYATKKSKIHPATAAAYGSGLIFGVANGLLVAPSLGIDIDGAPGDGEINQNYLLFGLTTLGAGAAAGYWLGSEYRPTQGQVTTTSMAGFTGIASTGLLFGMIQPDLDGETVAVLLALGMDAGLAGGAVLTRDLDWSPSRANYVALSQFLGVLGGFTLGAITVGEPDGDDEGRVYSGLVLGGIWAGLAGGIYLTRDMDPDTLFASEKATAVTVTPLLGEDLQGIALGGQF